VTTRPFLISSDKAIALPFAPRYFLLHCKALFGEKKGLTAESVQLTVADFTVF
jgi:hypothetical protein